MEGAAPTLPAPTSSPADLSQAAVDAAIAAAQAETPVVADEPVAAPVDPTPEPVLQAAEHDAAPVPEPVAEAPALVAGPAASGEDTTPETLTSFLTRYGQYVALFVGAGLISGSIVHFPLAPVRYGLIGLVGGGLFAAASAWAERDRPTPELVRVAVAALALALGIGMVSGSIQHFQDIPERAAVLVPLGFVLSLVAFMVRYDQRPRREDLMAAVAWALVAMFVLFEGLGRLADAVGTPTGHHAPAAAHGHGHGHGAGKPAAAAGTDKPGAAEKPAAGAHADKPAAAGTHAAQGPAAADEHAVADDHGH